jgi:protein-L-isoaspartate(D-aspartate) O-methyltransferase
MVRTQIQARGIRDSRVLEAMRRVPRERFVPSRMAEFAYEDSALPIEAEQTISQPFVVALMTEALQLGPDDRVLEIGTGSGYAAAILGQICAHVVTVERHASLAETAAEVFTEQGYDNIEVHVTDGSMGWPEGAPYDAIVSTAGGPRVPPALVEQLRAGGRLVMPIGDRSAQTLVRLTKSPEGVREEKLGDVRFVPLVGAEAWPDPKAETSASSPRSEETAHPGAGGESADDELPAWRRTLARAERRPASLTERIADEGEVFERVEDFDLERFVDRVRGSRVVLLGESTHGTSEFYALRARMTQALIERAGFRAVALESDWPDGAELDRRARRFDQPGAEPDPDAFTRFPVWMWQNREFDRFVAWLRDYDEGRPFDERVGIYGLDLYSLHRSARRVIEYLEEVDPTFAEVARNRYACLSPWESDPAAYGLAAITERYRACEDEVVAVLDDLLKSDLAARAQSDHEGFFQAAQNAYLVRNAESYYREMYRGSRASWNLRDRHMFETLERLLDHLGSDSKVVVWAHNSHAGDARATEMGARGESNLGQHCRERFGERCWALGFGTDHGTVMAAHEWDGPHEVRTVRPAHAQSYERLFHESGAPALTLPLRGSALREPLSDPRLERAIGVIYRPETELQSHYFHASLPVQFDEYVWFDASHAVGAPARHEERGVPETYPFGV